MMSLPSNTRKDHNILDWATLRPQLLADEFTQQLYKEVPLYGNTKRGTILEAACRRLEEANGWDHRDAARGVDRRGRLFGSHASPWDWERCVGGSWLRVEHKTGIFGWSQRGGWHLRFDGIKPENFDILILCAYTPGGCEWFEIDKDSAMSNVSSVCSNRAWRKFRTHWGRTRPRGDWFTAYRNIRRLNVDKGLESIGTMPWPGHEGTFVREVVQRQRSMYEFAGVKQGAQGESEEDCMKEAHDNAWLGKRVGDITDIVVTINAKLRKRKAGGLLEAVKKKVHVCDYPTCIQQKCAIACGRLASKAVV